MTFHRAKETTVSCMCPNKFSVECVSLQIADMLSSRGSHACAVLDDKLYAIGGWAALKPLVRPKVYLNMHE